MQMSGTAKAYWTGTVLAGGAILSLTFAEWSVDSATAWRICFYTLIAIATAGLKIRLPGATGTVSMSFPVIVLALMELGLPAALIMGVSSALAQSVVRPKVMPRWEQVVFSAFGVAIPILLADRALHLGLIRAVDPSGCMALLSACVVYFVVNMGIVAGIIGLTTNRSPLAVWKDSFLWTAPQYLVGGSIAGAFHFLNRYVSWQGLVLALPPIYLVYRSYSVYLARAEEHRKHIEDMAQLHWRTIEALALAIDAKDDTTAAHLRRVQVYAAEVAKELNVDSVEMQAIQAASLLHDIGKLAVPEYIISKPGRLTPEEFEKMKIHPIVGAEILERVSFPYPVVPIVRSHHEKWDGTGYPDGLSGEQIPIGARILAAVDCLDALASDRQYRRALPLHKAMEIVVKESGVSFDPRIVEILERRYEELEALAKQASGDLQKVSSDIKVERGVAPAAGFAISHNAAKTPDHDASPEVSLAGARREMRTLFTLANLFGSSLSLDDCIGLIGMRLAKLMPHDAIAIYLVEQNSLRPKFVKGENYRLFSALQIPVGQGLSGWVAENHRPIVNGNPAVEPGYLNDPSKITTLRSALSVPLHGKDGVVAVISLYHLAADAYNQDHLRMLLSLASDAGLIIEKLSTLREKPADAVSPARRIENELLEPIGAGTN